MATEKKRTIVEAILEVLRTAGRPMTAAEIYDSIVAANLYTFKSSTPVQIVRAQIRRHCADVNLPKSARVKYFKMLSDGKYGLASSTKA